MAENKPVDCPLCGAGMKIHEDAVGSVAGCDVGFYVAHPLWTNYPQATDCAVYAAAAMLAKRSTYEECASSWERVANIVKHEGADGIFMNQLTSAYDATGFPFDASGSMSAEPDASASATRPAVVEKLQGTNIQQITDEIFRTLPYIPTRLIIFTDGEPDDAMRRARLASILAGKPSADTADR